MSSSALEADLRALGIACTIEARDRLAILIPLGDSSALEQEEVRRAAVRLAESRGFTHLALELPDR